MNMFRRLRGDVPTTDLAAYRQAAGTVTDLFQRTEQLKTNLASAQSHPWLASTEYQQRLIACWLPQAYFNGASRMFEAAGRVYGTADYLPPSVVDLIAAVYRLGKEWEVRAQHALANPAYRLDVSLPAGLPNASPADAVLAPVEVEVWAALVELLKREADALMGEVGYSLRFNAPQGEFKLIAQRFEEEHKRHEVEAEAKLELWQGRPEGTLRRELYSELKRLAAAYLTFGQQLFQPELLNPSFKVRRPVDPIDPLVRRLPSYIPHLKTTQDLQARLGLGFDPWELSDPDMKTKLERDPASLRQLEAFWRSDPDPAKTRAFHAEVEAEVAAGRMAYRSGEAMRACPWARVATALQTTGLAGERFGAGSRVAFVPGLVEGKFVHRFQRLGQDPTIVSGNKLKPYQSGTAASTLSAPLPSKSPPATDSDIWFMTDPDVAQAKARDASAARQLTELWAAAGRLDRIRRSWQGLKELELTGAIRRRVGEALRVCPWPSAYTAMQTVSVAGERLAAGEIFVFTVQLENGTAVRRVQRLGRDTSVASSKPKLPPYQP